MTTQNHQSHHHPILLFPIILLISLTLFPESHSSLQIIPSQTNPLLIPNNTTFNLITKFQSNLVLSLINSSSFTQLILQKQKIPFSYEATFAKINQNYLIFLYGPALNLIIYSNSYEIISEKDMDIMINEKAFSVSKVIVNGEHKYLFFSVKDINKVLHIIFFDWESMYIYEQIDINEDKDFEYYGGDCVDLNEDYYGTNDEDDDYIGLCITPMMKVYFITGDFRYVLKNAEIENEEIYYNMTRNNSKDGVVKIEGINKDNFVICFYYNEKTFCGTLKMIYNEGLVDNVKIIFYNDSYFLSGCKNINYRNFDIIKLNDSNDNEYKYGLICGGFNEIKLTTFKIHVSSSENSFVNFNYSNYNLELNNDNNNNSVLKYLSFISNNKILKFIYTVNDNIYIHTIDNSGNITEISLLPSCINTTLSFYLYNTNETKEINLSFISNYLNLQSQIINSSLLSNSNNFNDTSTINSTIQIIYTKLTSTNNSFFTLKSLLTNVSITHSNNYTSYPLSTPITISLINPSLIKLPIFLIEIQFLLYNPTTSTFSSTCSAEITLEKIDCYSSCEYCSSRGTYENHKCKKCKDNYFPLFNDSTNCFYQSDIVPHYYFNELTLKFELCSEKCYTCYSLPFNIDTNCYECSEGYIMHPLDESTCVKPCENESYWFIDEGNKNAYTCTVGKECPNNYPYLNEQTLQCESTCTDPIKKFKYNSTTCVSKCPKNTIVDEENSNCYDIPDILTVAQIENLLQVLPKNTLLNTEFGIAFIYNSSSKGLNQTLELTNKSGLIYVDLNECIDVVKNVWFIPPEDDLIIVQIETNKSNLVTNNIDYLMFNSQGDRLNISVCDDLKIKVSYYITNIDGIDADLGIKLKDYGIDIYDGRDAFFNSYCLNFTSENKTDVVLKDRRNFYFKNISYCETNCTYLDVDLTNRRVQCACSLKIYKDYNPDEEEQQSTSPDFTKEITNTNYEVIFCYNKVFNLEYLKTNWGNYINLITIFIFICILIQYCRNGNKNIISYIIKNNETGKKFFLNEGQGMNNNNNDEIDEFDDISNNISIYNRRKENRNKDKRDKISSVSIRISKRKSRGNNRNLKKMKNSNVYNSDEEDNVDIDDDKDNDDIYNSNLDNNKKIVIVKNINTTNSLKDDEVENNNQNIRISNFNNDYNDEQEEMEQEEFSDENEDVDHYNINSKRINEYNEEEEEEDDDEDNDKDKGKDKKIKLNCKEQIFPQKENTKNTNSINCILKNSPNEINYFSNLRNNSNSKSCAFKGNYLPKNIKNMHNPPIKKLKSPKKSVNKKINVNVNNTCNNNKNNTTNFYIHRCSKDLTPIKENQNTKKYSNNIRNINNTGNINSSSKQISQSESISTKIQCTKSTKINSNNISSSISQVIQPPQKNEKNTQLIQSIAALKNLNNKNLNPSKLNITLNNPSSKKISDNKNSNIIISNFPNKQSKNSLQSLHSIKYKSQNSKLPNNPHNTHNLSKINNLIISNESISNISTNKQITSDFLIGNSLCRKKRIKSRRIHNTEISIRKRSINTTPKKSKTHVTKSTRNVHSSSNESNNGSTNNNTSSNVDKRTQLNYQGMTYDTAILIDNRKFTRMYLDCLLDKHIIISLIFNSAILLKQIKISVFLVSTTTDFFFNAFFYSDEYISQVYKLEGKTRFFLNLPKSIISYIATVLFTYFLEFLTSSKFLVILIKTEFEDKFYSQCNAFIKKLKCKIKIYFIVGFIFLIFFWYYVSAFCGVYQNSQTDWIRDSFFSFILGLFTPFFSCFFATVLRFSAIKCKSIFMFKVAGIVMFLI